MTERRGEAGACQVGSILCSVRSDWLHRDPLYSSEASAAERETAWTNLGTKGGHNRPSSGWLWRWASLIYRSTVPTSVRGAVLLRPPWGSPSH